MTGRLTALFAVAATGLCLLGGAGGLAPAVISSAAAMTIEMKGDAGIDRIERQRRASRGQLPLPGTPDLTRLDARIAEAGFAPNAPIFLRLFKDSSTLEVWMQKGQSFALFARYPICNWDGGLGPKQAEGDRQSPEGFFVVGEGQLRWRGRYHRAFDLSYPTLYEEVQGRTGSAILIHGACSTIGCFAMTNPVIDELFMLATRAMHGGQRKFSVHVYPFAMTEANLKARAGEKWIDYWRNLKIGYDLFERTHVPPQVGVCNRSYTFRHGEPGSVGSGQIGYQCGMWMAGGGEVEAARVAALPLPKTAVPEVVARASARRATVTRVASGPWRPSKRVVAFVSQQIAAAGNEEAISATKPSQPGRAASSRPDSVAAVAPARSRPRVATAGPWTIAARSPVRRAGPRSVTVDARGNVQPVGLSGTTARAFAGPTCNPGLASCRKFMDLKIKRQEPTRSGSPRPVRAKAQAVRPSASKGTAATGGDRPPRTRAAAASKSPPRKAPPKDGASQSLPKKKVKAPPAKAVVTAKPRSTAPKPKKG